MPSYNFLNKPSDTLGNGTDSSSMRGFAYGTTNQTAGEALTITTGFRPAYIAVCYGENAESAMLIYNEDCDFIKYNEYSGSNVSLGTQFYATASMPLLSARNEWISSGEFDNERDFISTNWRFGIINVFNTGFTLKATMVEEVDPVPTGDCILWWFALAKTPSKTINTISGKIGPLNDEEKIVDCGFIPDFLVILQTMEPESWNYIINGIIYWNKQRDITKYLGAGTGDNCELTFSENSTLAYPDDEFGPWVDWTDSGFKVYGYDDNSFFYFAAKGLPEASE